MKHFAVIGAGITGVTTAWVLRQRGYDVTGVACFEFLMQHKKQDI